MKLTEFRAKHGLTQKELADIIGMTRQSVAMYESGDHEPTARNKIIIERRLAKYERKNPKVD